MGNGSTASPGVSLLAGKESVETKQIKKTPETEFVKFIREEEENILFEYIDRKASRSVRLTINLMHKIGIRISEAVKVNIRDIDFNNKLLSVYQPKTKKMVYRVIPDIMILRLRTYTKQYKDEIEQHNGFLCFPGHENVNHKHKDHIRPSTVRCFFKTFRDNTGVNSVYYVRKNNAPFYRVTSHTLRSNWITKMYKVLISKGYSHLEALKTIQREIGHKKIETTMRYIRFENVKEMAKEGVNSLFSMPSTISDSHNVQSLPETH